MNDNLTTWLYFFSSVFQGNAALLSVLAVFVVLRLQSIAAQMQAIDARIEAYLSVYMMQHAGHSPIAVPYSRVLDLPYVIRDIADGRISLGHVAAKDLAKALEREPVWRGLFLDRKVLLDTRSRLLSELAAPSLWLAVLIILPLILLTRYSWLTEMTAAVYLITVLLEVAALLVMFRFVYGAMKPKPERPPMALTVETGYPYSESWKS